MSRPQAIHEHSIAAYRSEGEFSARARAVLEWITNHGPATDRQVMEGMGFREPNAVRPRCTELIQAGALMEVCSVKCPVTGKTVRKVDIIRARQGVLL